MSDNPKMPRYLCHKRVSALQIRTVAFSGGWMTLYFMEPGFASIKCDPAFMARYTPVSGDYYVIYDDNYASISPRKAFEDGYSRIDP